MNIYTVIFCIASLMIIACVPRPPGEAAEEVDQECNQTLLILMDLLRKRNESCVDDENSKNCKFRTDAFIILSYIFWEECRLNRQQQINDRNLIWHLP